MIYIGNDKISDFYIGNDKIAQQYIGNDLVYESVQNVYVRSIYYYDSPVLPPDFYVPSIATLPANYSGPMKKIYTGQLYYYIHFIDKKGATVAIFGFDGSITPVKMKNCTISNECFAALEDGEVVFDFTTTNFPGKTFRYKTTAYELCQLVPAQQNISFDDASVDDTSMTVKSTVTGLYFPEYNYTYSFPDDSTPVEYELEYYNGNTLKYYRNHNGSTAPQYQGADDAFPLVYYYNGEYNVKAVIRGLPSVDPKPTIQDMENGYPHDSTLPITASFRMINLAHILQGYTPLDYIVDTQSGIADGWSTTDHSYISLPFHIDNTATYEINAELEPTGIYWKNYYTNAVFYGQEPSNAGICKGMGMFFNGMDIDTLVLNFCEQEGHISATANVDENTIIGKRLTVYHTSSHGTITDNLGNIILDGQISPSSYLHYDDYDAPFTLWGGGIEYTHPSCSPIGFKLYSFDMTINGNMVYDLHPVFNQSTSEYGLLNYVDGVFYTTENADFPFTGYPLQTNETIIETTTSVIPSVYTSYKYNNGSTKYFNYYDRYHILVLPPDETVTSLNGMFTGTNYLKAVKSFNLDTSHVTDMGYMFHIQDLQEVNMPNIDTSNVQSIQYIFNGAHLSTIDVSNWDLRNCEDMGHAFESIDVTSLDLSSWQTSSKLENMSYMFAYSTNLTDLDLSGWDVSGVNLFTRIFEGCNNLSTINLNGWQLQPNVDLLHAFRYVYHLQTVYIDDIGTLNILTNNMSSTGGRYIPNTAEINFNNGQTIYIWDSSTSKWIVK